MNKKKEIEKMACDICLWRHGCNSPNNPIESCKPLHMAKKAVEAGYGDVRSAVREFAGFLRDKIFREHSLGNQGYIVGFKEMKERALADVDALVKEVCGDDERRAEKED